MFDELAKLESANNNAQQNDSKFSLDLENDSMRKDGHGGNGGQIGFEEGMGFLHDPDEAQEDDAGIHDQQVVLDDMREDDDNDDPLNRPISDNAIPHLTEEEGHKARESNIDYHPQPGTGEAGGIDFMKEFEDFDNRE